MKKILSIFLILFLTVSLSACAPNDNIPVNPGTPTVEEPGIDDEDTQEPVEEEEEEVEPEEEEEVETEEAEEEEVETEEEAREQEADLYFANLEYVESGDESLDHLKSEKRMIAYEDTTFEEAVIRELIKGPQAEDLTTGFPDTLNLLQVKVMENIAYVDFASDGLSGGSLQESLTIGQIVESLTGIEGVDKVQFLVDGKEADSLMGHVSIDQPFEGE